MTTNSRHYDISGFTVEAHRAPRVLIVRAVVDIVADVYAHAISVDNANAVDSLGIRCHDGGG